MKLYVVSCFMEGCEECGNEYHIVGIFSTKEKAQEAEKQHNKYKHLHSYNTDIDEVTLDEFQKSYRESELDHTKIYYKCSKCKYESSDRYVFDGICPKCKINIKED